MTARRAVALLLASMWLGTAARAQETFEASTPLEGEVLQQAPAPMVIKFTEGIRLKKVVLRAADGATLPIDWTASDAEVYDVAFRATGPLPAGKYQIEWTAVVHGHSDGGVITFRLEP
jgi:methionine-rich copper-binding protein CopC